MVDLTPEERPTFAVFTDGSPVTAGVFCPDHLGLFIEHDHAQPDAPGRWPVDEWRVQEATVRRVCEWCRGGGPTCA